MYVYIYYICVIYIFNIQALSIVQTMSSVVANIPRQFFNILSRVYIYIRVDILFLLIRLIVINKLSVTLHVKYVFVHYWGGGGTESGGGGLGRGDVHVLWPVCLR